MPSANPELFPVDPGQRTAQLAQNSSPEPALSPHESLVAALETGARDNAPFLTLHLGGEPTVLDARAALEGARLRARLLQSRGVKRGDRVVLLMPTSCAFVETFLGANLIGAVPVPLASPMTFGGVGRYLRKLATIVETSGARLIMTSPRIREAIAEDELLKAQLDCVLCEDDTADGNGRELRLASVGGSDTAFLQFTSGTTGRPKGAIISHRALVSNTYAISKGIGIGPDDVVVSWLPLFHDMGLIGVLLTAICHVVPVHILRPESFLMKPGRWIELLGKQGGTLAAAPNFAYDLCVTRVRPMQGIDLAGWRAALNGSEAVHPATVKRFASHFSDNGFRPEAMMPVYGMAENTLAITFPHLDSKYETISVDRAALEQRGRAVRSQSADAHVAVSVGYPVAGASVRITESPGHVVSEGVVGEVETTGPSLMDGYFRNEQATSEALVDGWLRTGDLGFMEAGRLFIVGRAKEVIIKGGRNIYPYDVEQVASEVSGVVQGAVAAFSRPNSSTGTDDLVVMAETREKDPERRELMAKEIRGELLAVLGVKADEVRMGPVGCLPRTTSGKIRRSECARQLSQEASS